jgi:hypothetical protein
MAKARLQVKVRRMPTLKTKDGEINVSTALVSRMADRLYRLAGEGRRENYIAKARKRLEAGQRSRADAAIVIAVGG